MATRLDLAQKLGNYFNNPTFYDTQGVNDTLQDGIDEVCAFSGCVYASAVIPFTANKTYYDMLALLPNYIGVVAIFNDTIKRWMLPGSLKKFWQSRIDWDTAGGVPYYFCPVSHRYVAIYMKPLSQSYGRMVVFYRAAAPSPLTDTTVLPIPDEHLNVLERYGTADMWEQAQEWGKATAAFQEYTAGLEKLRVLMRNKRNADRYMSLR